jgi:chromosome segregation ATPase
MKPTVALACLVLILSPALLTSAPPNSQEAPSDTVTAERTVQIIWDAGAAPPDIDGALRQLFGPGGAGSIVERLLKQAAGRKVVSRSPKVGVSDHACTAGLAVNLSGLKDNPMVAREIADELVNRLASILRDQRREESEVRLARVHKEVVDLQNELSNRRRVMQDRQARLQAETGRVDLSAVSLQAALSKLEDERQRLELELAGMEARLDAVQEQFKSTVAKAKDEAAADPVLAEMEKSVQAREKLLDVVRKRFEQGMAPPQELSKAEADLSDAKIQLLDRKSASAARGGDALAPLTREMQNLAIDIRDRKARLAQVEKQRKPLIGAAEGFQSLEDEQEKVALLRRTWEEAQTRLREAQRQADATPVDRVIVTNATEVPAQRPEGQ